MGDSKNEQLGFFDRFAGAASGIESRAPFFAFCLILIRHHYDDMGHFCLEDMGTQEFPDLLAAILR